MVSVFKRLQDGRLEGLFATKPRVDHVTLPVNADPSHDHDFSIVDLPEIEQAATIVHRGAMDNVMRTIQTLARWINADGCRSAGYNRELYIECGENRDAWVTELQELIATS